MKKWKPESISLEQMLDARERRSAMQQRLLTEYRCPLICFTMNIVGDIKLTPLVAYAFRVGVNELKNRLGNPLFHRSDESATGCEAYLVYDAEGDVMKQAAIATEESVPAGRLYDIDVLLPSGEKLSRPVQRRCVVCGGPATVCACSRAHGLEAVRSAERLLLENFAAERLGRQAREALLGEVYLTPKPGLVDRNNSGSHTDMDYSLYLRSAAALYPHFKEAVRLGMSHAGCAERLRAEGQAAEADMFSATGGVNTHKGANYSFLVLLYAMGCVLSHGGDLFGQAAEVAMATDSGLPENTNTHGTRVRQLCGAKGVRGEAMAGFPHARKACRVLEKEGELSALLSVMAELEDTNIIYRGGEEALEYMRKEAVSILERPASERAAAVRELDRAFCARHLSPGGCADILALAIFLSASSDALDVMRKFALV